MGFIAIAQTPFWRHLIFMIIFFRNLDKVWNYPKTALNDPHEKCTRPCLFFITSDLYNIVSRSEMIGYKLACFDSMVLDKILANSESDIMLLHLSILYKWFSSFFGVILINDGLYGFRKGHRLRMCCSETRHLTERWWHYDNDIAIKR